MKYRCRQCGRGLGRNESHCPAHPKAQPQEWTQAHEVAYSLARRLAKDGADLDHAPSRLSESDLTGTDPMTVSLVITLARRWKLRDWHEGEFSDAPTPAGLWG